MLAIFFVLSCAAYWDSYRIKDALTEKVLRFHVIANSDSTKDQQVKLQVRNAVGTYMQQQLAGADSKAEAIRIAQTHTAQIKNIAEETLRQAGCTQSAKVVVGEVDFPQKTYGPYQFPAGRYDAVEIILGEGDGRNWWCVMYPNLCFQGSVYEVTEKEGEKALRQVLDEEEYMSVIKSGKYRTRLWLCEIFR